MSRQSNSGWFDRGARAFKAAQPQASAAVRWPAFYVCPICLVAFPPQALSDGRLTREHVPPRSVGGRRLILTCKACNEIAGYRVDAHADREAALHRFARGETANRRAFLSTSSGSIPIRLSSSKAGIVAAGIPKATDPILHASVMADFDRVAREGSWRGFKFEIAFEAFDQSLVRLSWLRAGYLAWFAALGYRFILRAEMASIREKIRHFDAAAEPLRFRMLVRNQLLRPQLVVIDEPRELRCFAMLYEFNAVLFPRRGDSEFYERLAQRPDEFSESLSGFEVPWPSGPVFAWDLEQS